MLLFFCLMVILFVLIFLWKIWYYWKFRFNFKKNREKSSAFECGFDGKNTFRSSFSFRFFYMLMMFLIFDIELALLLGLPLYYEMNIFLKMFIQSVMFILIFGLLYEWNVGALSWKM